MTRKVRFSGFSEGSAVSLSVTKGGAIKGPLNVSAWKQAEAADMSITVTRPSHTLMAPAAIWFEAEVTGATGLDNLTNGQDREGNTLNDAVYNRYDQQFHELEFEWSFGDTGTWEFASRLPTQLQQRDYGHGKVIAHVFSTPGDKTVTCTAYRMGTDGSGNLTRTSVASKTITFADGGDYPTIQSMEDAIPLSRRIYFDPDGTYNSEPVGATLASSLAANTIWRCGEWAEGQSKPEPVAILIKKGTSFTYSDANLPGFDHPNLYIGTYGTGDRPIGYNYGDSGLFGTGLSQWTGGNRGGFFILDGVEVVGNWDVVNETGSAGGAAFSGQAITHHLAHDCVFRDMDGPIISTFIGHAPDLQLRERSFVICDTEVTGWRDYGLLAPGGVAESFRQDIAIIGCDFHQPANAAIGARGNISSANVHGPIRCEVQHHLVIRSNNVFSRTHWDALCQPCIRMNTNSAQQWDQEPGYTVVYGNSLEGGNIQIISACAGGVDGVAATYYPSWHTELSSRAYAWPVNTLVKHNLLLGSYSVATAVQIFKGATSIVENVFVFPDVQRWATNDVTSRKAAAGEEGFLVAPGGETTQFNDFNGWVADIGDANGVGLSEDNPKEPARIIGNTIIDLKTTGSADDKTIAGSTWIKNMVGLQEERDNTLYAPNYTSTPVTSTGPWDFVENITPLETFGVRHDMNEDGTYTELTSYATGATDVKLYRPAWNASIANDGTGPASHRDFFGTVRTTGQKATKGAMEPG